MVDIPLSSAQSGLVCWRCGIAVIEKLPLRREARCACGADLHCCRLCLHHEPRWTRGCREQRAEDPRARDVANFCDWFKPRPDAFAPTAPTSDARSTLDSLFKK